MIKTRLPGETEKIIIHRMEEAEQKAWEALAGYKGWMFGYHFGRWVNFNQLLPEKKRNPFIEIIKIAREKVDKEAGE